jgi:hypothetical protein
MTNDETRERARTETWDPAATIALVNQGFTVTWLLLDGHYVMIATNNDTCYSGIGKRPDDCWASLRTQMAARSDLR